MDEVVLAAPFERNALELAADGQAVFRVEREVARPLTRGKYTSDNIRTRGGRIVTARAMRRS